MKLLTKKKVIIGAAAFVCALCAAFAVGQMKATPTDVLAHDVVTSAQIDGVYTYGDSFTAPNGKIVYGNQELDATSVYVKFPDGTLRKGNTHVLSLAGAYTVIYAAEYNGKTLTAEKSFIVNEQAYAVSSATSSFEYVDDLKTTETEMDAGLKISLAEGDVFQYNQLIDLSQSTTQTPLMKIYPYTYSILADNVSVDSYYTVIRLTDYYNPDVYVEVSIGFYLANAALGRYHPYVVAGANGQSKSGLGLYSGASTTRRIVYIDNERYRVYYGTNDYGTEMDPTPDTPVNGVSINNFDNYGASVYYEAATKRVYVKSKTMHFITDLDEAAIYDGNLFGGFTTGEVLLSVYANEYAKSTATYEIAEINGVKGVDLKDFELVDNVKPAITLSNDADNFYIAKGEEFTLFDAAAKDKNLVGGVNAYVYYEYGTNYQTLIYVKDGKFTPTRKGKYTIVYTAKDAFGNEGKRLVNCTCISMSENKLVTLSTTPIASAKAGEVIHLNDYTLKSVNAGEFIRTYAVFAGDRTQKIEIDSVTKAFLPRNIGAYEIVFEYGDSIKSYTYSYTMDVTSSDNVYMEDVLLPNYLIKGATYSFERAYAETYAGATPVLVQPEVFVNADGNGYTSTPISYSAYVVEAEESVQFKYVYNGNVIYESQPVQVVDVGFNDALHLENYFVGEITKQAYFDYVRLQPTAKTGDVTVDFVNAVSFSQFALNFAIPMEFSSMSGVDIVLTDYYDYTKTVTIRYEKTISGIKFSVDNKAAVASATSFAGTTHQLWYDENALAFVDANGNSFEMANPFTSDKVYLSFTIVGAAGDSALDIYKIGSQFINTDGYDWVNATVYVRDAISGIIDYGTTLTFKPAEITDVLTPYVESAYSFYVLNGKDEYVYANNQVLLDGTQPLDVAYTITFSEYGMYRVVYEYRDQFGNPAENVVVLYVNDRVPPEITLDKGYGEDTVLKTKVGEKVDIVGYTVNDNFGGEEVSVVIRVISPNNVLTSLNGTSFTPDKKGEWKVVYYATDAEGNYTIVYYTVKAV